MVHVGEEASCLSVGLSAGVVCCDRRGGRETDDAVCSRKRRTFFFC